MQPMIDFFVEQLRFRVDTVVGKQPAFAMLCRDENTVMLACRPAIPWPHKGWAIYFWVDNVDAFTLEVEQLGAQIKCGPAMKDYGCKEVEIMTPDGRVIVFGQVVS
jgi:predicted enzyme related to lactoylglutathione lyase